MVLLFFGSLFGTETENIFSVDLFGEARITESSNFVPVLASVNGFDFNDKVRFYLLAMSKEGIHKGFLTIDKFGLRADDIEKYILVKDDEEKTTILKKFLKSQVEKFRESMGNFQSHESALRQIEATPKQLVAIALDLYNINRRVQSVTSDANLLNRVIREYEKAEDFFKSGSDLSLLLGYMSQINISFSSQSEERTDIENLLQERKAYSNLINRLLKGKNKDKKERDKYIKSQLKAMADLKKAGVLQKP